MNAIWRSLNVNAAVFSAKTFGAAILALYIAFRLDLEQPAWALTTVYVVAQPYAGMVVAKSLYRFIGTLLGAIVSVGLVAVLGDAPELFCLALAAWIGAATFVSIYLRDEPRAYAAVLAGYSAAIIGLPAALAPAGAFDFAAARCLEISIGISCGTLVHNIVAPQQASVALLRTIDAALPALARWTEDALSGRAATAEGDADRRRIISDIVGLDGLRVYALIDTPAIRSVDGVVRQLEGKLLSILALLVSVSDRLRALRRSHPDVAEALRPELEARAALLNARSASESATPAPIPQPLDATQAFLVRSIRMRCDDILQLWREAWDLERRIRQPSAARTAAPEVGSRRYRDVRLAWMGGLISALAILVSSAFWIATAWPSGTTAVTFAGVICAIMSARDNPTAISGAWLRVTLAAGVLSSVGALAILPQATNFETLVAALAPFYLVAGALLTSPATAGVALPAIFVCSALLGVSNHMAPDFAALLNGLAAIFIGILIAHVLLGVLRPIGTEWFVTRLVAGVRDDLAELARGGSRQDSRGAFESRMFDRINALLLRLPADAPGARDIIDGALAGVRIGLNLLLLDRVRPSLPPGLARAVDEAAAALARHMRSRGRDAAEAALSSLDAAADAVLRSGRDNIQPAADALLGVATTLRQHAGFFGGATGTAPMLEEAPA